MSLGSSTEQYGAANEGLRLWLHQYDSFKQSHTQYAMNDNTQKILLRSVNAVSYDKCMFTEDRASTVHCS